MNSYNRNYSAWDFEHETTHCFTNNFHKYPAMMVPKLLEELLKEYCVPDGIFLDPFCGTGRSLLAARMAGMLPIGIDINPLAVLIAKVKLLIMDPLYLKEKLKEIISCLNNKRNNRFHNLCIPSFYNREYWFADSICSDIVLLMESINDIFRKSCDGKDFYYVVLSETIRDVSWTRKSEFKLYRINEAAKRRFNPDVYNLFYIKAKRNIEGMKRYKEACKYRPEFKIIQGDARDLCTDTRIKAILNKEVDTIITSPPYGDSRTTVDYGNFSRLSLQWLRTDKKFSRRWNILNENDIKSINAKCLGGTIKKSITFLPSETLRQYVEMINLLDVSRANKVYQFYEDLYICFQNCIKVLTNGGYLILIIANRSVKGYQIPMNDILCEYANHCDIKSIATIERNIIGKKLPRKINTNNKQNGQTDTMIKEYVMVFRKE